MHHISWFRQLRRALVFVRPHRRASLVILALALLVSGLAAVEPLLMKQVFDELTEGRVGRGVLAALLLLLGIGVGKEALGAFSNWLSWKVRIAVHYGLLEATVQRLHTLPISFHLRGSVGGTMTRLERGIGGFVGALSEIVSSVLPALAYLAISVVVMFHLDWRLSIVVLVFTPIPAVIGLLAAEEQTTRERTLLEGWVRIYARFNEVLSGIMTVKSFTMEEAEKRRFLRDVDEANGVVVRGVRTDSSVGAVKNAVTMLARLAVIAVGSWLVLEGRASVGTLVAFLGYVGGLFGPVQGLTNIYQTLRKAAVSLETIFEILDASDTLCDAPGARPLPAVKGDVAFRNVTFTYPGSDEPVIHDVSIHARPGEMVALVGPSGGGKSTLMALAQRLYDPGEGSVTVDGADIRGVRQKSLRENIGIVLQETLLFNDTVRHNIAYGRPRASMREVERAARAANAHDFVMELPEGYDTVVGERGTRLSTGQRQRIAIARALLKDPPILILDEATSALDAESEEKVQRALETLMKGRTSFVVAHRLATIVGADRIVVLQDGRVTERGSHEDLMAARGYYASLVDRQTRGLVSIGAGAGPRARTAAGVGAGAGQPDGARAGAGGGAGDGAAERTRTRVGAGVGSGAAAAAGDGANTRGGEGTEERAVDAA